MAKWSKEMKERAIKDGLKLCCIEINGRTAKTSSFKFTGPIGPKTSDLLYEFFHQHMLNPDKRVK